MTEPLAKFWIAIGFTVCTVALVMIVFIIHWWNSKKHLINEQLFSSNILESSAALIVVLNTQNKILAINQACRQLIGFSEAEVEQQSVEVLALLPEELLENYINEQKLAGKDNSRFILHSMLSRNGQKYLIDWQIRYVYSDSGQLTLKIGSGLDVTELTAMQHELLIKERKMREIAEMAEERERWRIAEELHNQINQSLVLSRMKMEKMREMAPSVNFSELIGELEIAINDALQDTRKLISELNPPGLRDLGIVPALESLARRYSEQFQTVISYRDDGTYKLLQNSISLFVFKTARELLMNAFKHSKATHIIMESSFNKSVFQLIISDNGDGFDAPIPKMPQHIDKHFGLNNIHTRVAFYNGTFEMHSTPGKGSKFILKIPVQEIKLP